MVVNTFMDEETDGIDDLLSQLAANKKTIQSYQREIPDVTSDTLGQFLIKTATELITKTLDAIDAIQDRMLVASTPEDTEAYASVLKASATAIETLNKLHISNERNKTVMQVKDKEIQARLAMNQEDNTTRLTVSREEMLRTLVEKGAAEAVKVAEPVSLAKQPIIDIDVDPPIEDY